MVDACVVGGNCGCDEGRGSVIEVVGSVSMLGHSECGEGGAVSSRPCGGDVQRSHYHHRGHQGTSVAKLERRKERQHLLQNACKREGKTMVGSLGVDVGV